MSWNGSTLGKLNLPTATSGKGIWSLRSQGTYKQANRWPLKIAAFENCFLWFDASNTSTVTLNGSNVVAITDLALQNIASQPIAARQPEYITAAKNGLNVMRFTAGNSHFLHLNQSAFPASHTMFAVIQRSATSTRQFILGNIDDFRFSHLWNSNGARTHQSNSSASVTFGTDDNTSTGWYYLTLRRDGTSSIQWRANGSTVATITTGTGVTNAANASFGTIGRTQTFYTSGDIGEVIAFNASLSDADRDSIEAYLAAKWSI